ncbi:MAG: hypothetical protein HUJ75_02670, partial [Parasporobacterium sp.]|nr:hypothetical protein [Parasporobacterium sp.]
MKKFLKNKLAAKLLVLALAISMVFALTGCLGLGVTVKVGTGSNGKPDIKIGYTDDVINNGEGPYFGDDDFEWDYNWDNDEDGGNYSASSIEGTIPVEYKEYDSTEFMSLCQDLTDAAKGTD